MAYKDSGTLDWTPHVYLVGSDANARAQLRASTETKIRLLVVGPIGETAKVVVRRWMPAETDYRPVEELADVPTGAASLAEYHDCEDGARLEATSEWSIPPGGHAQYALVAERPNEKDGEGPIHGAASLLIVADRQGRDSHDRGGIGGSRGNVRRTTDQGTEFPDQLHDTHTVAPIVGGPTSPPIPQGEMDSLSAIVTAG